MHRFIFGFFFSTTAADTFENRDGRDLRTDEVQFRIFVSLLVSPSLGRDESEDHSGKKNRQSCSKEWLKRDNQETVEALVAYAA